MRSRTARIWSGLIPLLGFMFGCAYQVATPPLTASEREANLASFEQVWNTVYTKHWDPEFGGVDWSALRDEVRPLIERAKSQTEVRGHLRRMLAQLGQSHFAILPARLYPAVASGEADGGAGVAGIDLRIVAGRALITAVDPGSGAEKAGCKLGWEILRAGGCSIPDLIAQLQQQYADRTTAEYRVTRAVLGRLRAPVGKTITIDVISGAGHARTLTLDCGPPRGRRAKFGHFPEVHVRTDVRRLAGGIGYIGFNYFLDPGYVMEIINKAMESFLDASGLVIDLRGNPGGLGMMAGGIAGWFIGEKGRELGTMTMRDGEIRIAVFPRASIHTGPLAILIDGLTVSTAEILAGGLQDLGRARLFGTRTAGAALPSYVERLPNGDGFQFAVANYTSSGGRVLEGRGVEPDEIVAPTRAGLLAGEDEVLDAAWAWITSMR